MYIDLDYSAVLNQIFKGQFNLKTKKPEFLNSGFEGKRHVTDY